MNENGVFVDQTLVSGIDFREDGRGFVVADFDQDGFLELGIVATQSPRFRVVELAENDEKSKSGNFIEVRLLGTNTTPSPQPDKSPLDPVGAILTVKTGTTVRMFQLTAGEGFSIQNSRAIHIGLGKDDKIDELKVRWPSGRITVEKDVRANSRIEISESAN